MSLYSQNFQNYFLTNLGSSYTTCSECNLPYLHKFVNYLKNKKEHLFLDLFIVLSFFGFVFFNKELENLFSGLATVRVLDLFLDSQLFEKLKNSILLYKNGQNLFHTNGWQLWSLCISFLKTCIVWGSEWELWIHSNTISHPKEWH